MQTDSEVASAISAQPIIGSFHENVTLGKTILLVEPEPFVRKVTAEVLKSADYKVVVARSGVDALEACGKRSQKVDLLLSDFAIPGMSSCELVEEFSTRYPLAPILLMSTSHDGTSHDEPALHKPSQHPHLSKPFSVCRASNEGA
jgi:CheY-like chemotaxis protein